LLFFQIYIVYSGVLGEEDYAEMFKSLKKKKKPKKVPEGQGADGAEEAAVSQGDQIEKQNDAQYASVIL
jgi:hypothetical protein